MLFSEWLILEMAGTLQSLDRDGHLVMWSTEFDRIVKLEYFKNPGAFKIYLYLKKIKDEEDRWMKGLIINDEAVVWSAFKAMHGDVANHLDVTPQEEFYIQLTENKLIISKMKQNNAWLKSIGAKPHIENGFPKITEYEVTF